MEPPRKVLIVDDIEFVRVLVAEILALKSWTCLPAQNGQEALQIYREQPDIAVLCLDWNLSPLSGYDILMNLKGFESPPAVLVMSGSPPSQEFQSVGYPKPLSFLQKPFDPATLYKAIDQLLDES